MVLAVHHVESIYLEEYHQGVFAGEEDVHVGDYLKVGDEEESEGQERSVLKGDVEGYAPYVYGATTFRPKS